MVQHAVLPEAPLASFDVAVLISQLPATLRASLRWIEPVYRKLVRRLEEEPLSDELVADIGWQAMEPMLSLGTAIIQEFLVRPEAWRVAITEALCKDAAILEEALPDAHSRASFAWIKGLFSSYFATLLPLTAELEAHELSTWFDTLERELLEETHPLMCAQMALYAALSLAKNQQQPARIAELVDIAFLELLKFRGVMSGVGVDLRPFSEETVQERAKRAIHYATLCREILTEKDAEAFGDARMNQLR